LLAEERFPEARSLLVNALELAPVGGPLVEALSAEARTTANRIALDRLAPPPMPRKWAGLLGVAVLLYAIGFGFFPGPLGSSFNRMLHPRAAAATLIQVTVEPGDITVPPARRSRRARQVTGTSRRPTLVFTRGSSKNDRIGMDRVGERWVASVRGIAAPGTYWVEVSGVRSPEYDVALSGQAGIVSFDLTYTYPAYTKLPAETQSMTRGDVSALVGTEVTVIVNLDRHAKNVSWTLPGGRLDRALAAALAGQVHREGRCASTW
jgi:hypothetical protein